MELGDRRGWLRRNEEVKELFLFLFFRRHRESDNYA
jgi:hypothetical protein